MINIRIDFNDESVIFSVAYIIQTSIVMGDIGVTKTIVI